MSGTYPGRSLKIHLNSAHVVFHIGHVAPKLVRRSSRRSLGCMTVYSHIIALESVEIGPQTVIKRIPAGHAERYVPSFAHLATLIDELKFWVSQNRVRLVGEAIVFIEKFLYFFSRRNACTLLAKIIWASTLQDTDVAAQLLEYDALEEAGERAANLFTGD